MRYISSYPDTPKNICQRDFLFGITGKGESTSKGGVWIIEEREIAKCGAATAFVVGTQRISGFAGRESLGQCWTSNDDHHNSWQQCAFGWLWMLWSEVLWSSQKRQRWFYDHHQLCNSFEVDFGAPSANQPEHHQSIWLKDDFKIKATFQPGRGPNRHYCPHKCYSRPPRSLSATIYSWQWQ